VPFRYDLFESRDEACWPCPSSTAACVTGTLAATWVPERHEIAHAVRSGICFTLIEEGYAMLYGSHFQDDATTGDIRVALAEAGSLLPAAHYPIATRFVAFLLETRGIETFRELCDAGGRDRQQFEQAVVKTYGVSFDELATEFDTYPEWSLAELRQDQACESADILVQPTEWDFHFECEAPGIEGKIGESFDTQRLVELPTEGMYQFIFESNQDLDLKLELRNCDRVGMASSFYVLEHVHISANKPGGYLAIKPYPAGVYVVRVRVDSPTSSVDLHVSVGPWP
jgi:hypothetical protein